MAYTRNNTTLEGVLERVSKIAPDDPTWLKHCSSIPRQYNTKLTRLSEPRLCAPEASSVEFDREGLLCDNHGDPHSLPTGTKFAVTFLVRTLPLFLRKSTNF